MTITTRRPDLHAALDAARSDAAATLASLEAARSDSEARQLQDGTTDLLKRVTGRSSLDAAILETRRLLESLERHRTGLQVSVRPSGTEMFLRREALSSPGA